eukprot:TRINITY_DN28657_c0_g1_i1.p1 TRINITY_DN28657_c0_g1~~TRINITY_DN28657_c0_g1_i1.p1  ORF type:complete len:569 (+),score=91.69 TRINITY_DN28657_c0_g1_i1:77-1783(+)
MKRSLATSTGEPPSVEEVKYAIEKRLFVGRVPSTTTDDELREVFSQYGPVNECRTVPGKGVAFVGFDTWAAAHRALIGTDLQSCLKDSDGLGLSVSFAERTSNVGRGGGAQYAKGLEHSRVFVGNLPNSITDNDFCQLFESFGTVKGANLLAAKSNRRCGFVNFALWGEALDAIETLDGQNFPGSVGEPMSVVFASPRDGEDGRHTAARREAHGRGVDRGLESLKASYVLAIEGDTSDEVCNELHNKIMAARFPNSAIGNDGASRSYGSSSNSFVNKGATSGYVSGYYDSGGGHDSAPPLPPPSYRHGGTLGASVPLPEGAGNFEERDAARLFVGGLPFSCTTEELRALIDQVLINLEPSMCQLTECRVLPDKGIGYVRFSSWEAAQESIAALNERSVSGWQLPLRVRWATPKHCVTGPPGQPQVASHSSSNSSGLAAVSGALQALLGTMHGSGGTKAEASQSLGGGGHGTYPSASDEESAIISQGMDPKKLFVGQLTRELTDQTALIRIFEAYGQIENFRWLEDKCVAYVQYSDFASASSALAALNGRVFPGVSREQGLNVKHSQLR